MTYDEYKSETERRNLLKKSDTLGSFDFYTSTCCLDSVNIDDVKKVVEMLDGKSLDLFCVGQKLTYADYLAARKVLPLAAHEYTHFVDATSTLWGLKHLNLMYDAYSTGPTYSSNEKEFFKAKQFYDHVRRIKLPDYYTVIESGIAASRPWTSTITIGNLFFSDGRLSDNRILFSRFSNSVDHFVVRSPVSIVSLLEASAMAQELETNLKLIEILDPANKLVEEAEFGRKTLDYLYNPELTEYSVCAHIVSINQDCSNVFLVFKLCSSLVRTVLNLPQISIDIIAKSCPVGEILAKSENSDFSKAIRTGLGSGDLGVIFYVLCLALPEMSYKDKASADSGICSALGRMGVDTSLLKDEIDSCAADLHGNLERCDSKSLLAISGAGYDNFGAIGSGAQSLNFSGINLPLAYLGDGETALIFANDSNQLSELSFQESFEELNAGESWVKNFSEACV